MDSITIHNIDDHLKRRLERQAAKHGVSVEEEALRVLAAALPYHENPQRDWALQYIISSSPWL